VEHLRTTLLYAMQTSNANFFRLSPILREKQLKSQAFLLKIPQTAFLCQDFLSKRGASMRHYVVQYDTTMPGKDIRLLGC